MKPPSIEFMMIAVRGIALLLALITLGWAIARWRRDTNRDAQRMFEQLDLVRAELLQLQGQMVTAPASKAIHHERYSGTSQNYSERPQARHENYGENYESERPISRSRPGNTSSADSPKTKTKSMTNAAPRGYEVAARLARNGASCEELMNTCALSRHEAELLVRLHAGMKSLQPPNGASAKNNAATNSNFDPTAQINANSNLNQLKKIGSRNHVTAPASARPVASRPTHQQRVSLVG